MGRVFEMYLRPTKCIWSCSRRVAMLALLPPHSVSCPAPDKRMDLFSQLPAQSSPLSWKHLDMVKRWPGFLSGWHTKPCTSKAQLSPGWLFPETQLESPAVHPQPGTRPALTDAKCCKRSSGVGNELSNPWEETEADSLLEQKCQLINCQKNNSYCLFPRRMNGISFLILNNSRPREKLN